MLSPRSKSSSALHLVELLRVYSARLIRQRARAQTTEHPAMTTALLGAVRSFARARRRRRNAIVTHCCEGKIMISLVF